MKTLSILVGVLLLVCGGFFAYMYVKNQNTRSGSISSNLMYDYIAGNQTLQDALALQNQGNFAASGQKVREALNQETDVNARGFLSMWAAQSEEYSGNYLSAIQSFKSIAANTNFTPFIRASAVQEMGLIYYSLIDPKITDAIFSGQPYSTMIVQGDVSETYLNLYKYSLSLYELAPSHLSIAIWYSNLLATNATTSDEVKAEYKKYVKQNLDLGDQGIAALSADPAQAVYFPIALFMKARILADMNLSGDSSFGNPETAFNAAFNAENVTGSLGPDSYLRLYYAIYLAKKYGSARTTDIQKLLSTTYVDSKNQNPWFKTFIKNERTDTEIGNIKSSLVLLASLDPAFKQYLVSQGWTEADFK